MMITITGENTCGYMYAYAQFAFEVEPLDRPGKHIDWERVFVLGFEIEHVEPWYEANNHWQHKQQQPSPTRR